MFEPTMPLSGYLPHLPNTCPALKTCALCTFYILARSGPLWHGYQHLDR